MDDVKVVQMVEALRCLSEDGEGVQLGRRRVLSFNVFLQGPGAQFQGDVLELPILLCAEVSNDVRVLVRFSEEGHFAGGDTKAGRKDTFHGNVAVIETTPERQGKGTRTLCDNFK